MKKLISFAMAIAVVFVGLVCVKPRSFAAESGLLTYTVTDGKACITGTTGTITGDFTVPAEIDGYPVVEIGNYAFYTKVNMNKHRIGNFTISEGIVKVGDYIVPNQLEAIKNIHIPSTLTQISEFSFNRSDNVESFTVNKNNPLFYADSSGVLFKRGEIEGQDILFSYPCARPSNYYIVPDYVYKIGDYAARYARVKHIFLSKNTKIIGKGAFEYSKIEEIDFGGTEQIGVSSFSSCNGLTQISLPDSVESLNNSSFSYCSNLKIVTIGSGIKTIVGSFHNCKSLEIFKIDEKAVCRINGGAFSGDKNLVSVIWGAGVYFADGSNAQFSGCTSLKSIDISENQNTSELRGAFKDCSSLEQLTAPRNLRYIKEESFYNCTSLKSVSLPKSLIEIGKNSFYNTPLETVYFEGSELDWKYMTIGEGNEALQNATVYFDCKIYPDLSDEPADFSAVDEAIERANALDKSLYSDESVAALEKAVNSVDKTLTADKQSTVDDYVSAINAAIRGLKYRQADYYSVEAALDAASKVRREYCTEESLAALDSAVNAVEYGLDIRRQSEVSEYARAINAALAAIKYFDANYSAVDAAVAAAAKVDRSMWSNTSLARLDAAVNSVEYGLDITQQSTVDLFADSINRAIAELAYGDVTLRHDGHGVIVSATTKSLKKQTTLSVEMKDPASHEGSNFAVGGNIRSLNFYDITLFDGGEETQPKDAVTVKIRLRDGVNPLKCRVYHVTDDPVDPLVRYANTLDGNYIVFETDHFSEFAVIEVEPTLSYIAVSSEPLKINYALGDKFDPTGLRITAALSDGSSAEVTDYYLSAVDTSTLGKRSVRVYYTKDEVTKMTAFDITVSLPEGTVTVTNAAILGADTLAYGNSTRLTLGTNDGANSYSVKWSSSDPSVAAVDANGNVTAKGRGSVTIKAEITNLDGTTVTAEKKLTCTMTFWQRVVAFFKGLFGKTKNIYFI